MWVFSHICVLGDPHTGSSSNFGVFTFPHRRSLCSNFVFDLSDAPHRSKRVWTPNSGSSDRNGMFGFLIAGCPNAVWCGFGTL